MDRDPMQTATNPSPVAGTVPPTPPTAPVPPTPPPAASAPEVAQAAPPPPPAAPRNPYAPVPPAGQPFTTYNGGVVPVPPPPMKPFLSDNRDVAMNLFVLFLGVFIGEMVLFVGGLGVGITVMTVLMYIGVMVYGRISGRAKLSAAPELYPANALLAASFTLLDPGQLGFLRLVLLTVLTSLHFMTLFGVRTGPRYTFRGLMQDGFGGTFVNFFGNPDKSFRVMKANRHDRSPSAVTRHVLLGLLIAIPLLLVLAALLYSADEAFAKQVTLLLKTLNVHFWEHVGRVLLGYLVSLFLFGYVYRLRYNDRMVTPVKEPRRGMPPAAVYTVLIAVCTLYVLFLCIAGNYLFSGLAGKLPESFSYASYARRGFFELLVVALINMAILLVTYIYTHRQEGGRPRGGLRLLLTLLVLETWLLIGSALSKMVMYIDEYGLTTLRVYTSWFMVLLMAVFLIALLQLWCKGQFGFKAVTVTGVVWFLILNLANTDGLIARYNVEAYRAGWIDEMDVEMFEELSDAMVGPAAELLSDQDPHVAAEAANVLKERQERWKDQKLGAWNLTTHQAKTRLNGLNAELEAGAKKYEYSHWEDSEYRFDNEKTQSVSLEMTVYAPDVVSITVHYGTGDTVLGSSGVIPADGETFASGETVWEYLYLPREICQDGWWYIQPELTTADGKTILLNPYDFMDGSGDLCLYTEVVYHPENDTAYWQESGSNCIIN